MLTQYFFVISDYISSLADAAQRVSKLLRSPFTVPPTPTFACFVKNFTCC